MRALEAVKFREGFPKKGGFELSLKEGQDRGLSGGAVVKNLPANAGHTGSSPGLERSHMLWSNQARAPQLQSPCATTTEAHVPRAHAPQQEKPPQ